ncbi:carbohydrate ABC transporter permease [Paenibacillus sp. J2TS4]|uniref:carbohydrate ABC transporter permease n=1 Tax=Paenibacillus sp. J2TS4 TaxID=2807194 RepID=UPI001B1EB7A3|nr:carbohydrate ABC transporter permease [Paenibacillus sp. J2TS4]GIP32515.1 membrane protein [Paenibacillus sp. J2TS4]
MKHSIRAGRPLVSVLGMLVFAVMLFPYLVMLITAFRTKSDIYKLPPAFFPREFTWNNFTDIWSAIPLGNHMTSTLIVASGATVLSLICAIPAAYTMARTKFAAQKYYLYLILTTQMFSPIVLLVGLYREISFVGLIDSWWALILVNAAFSQAFSVWILISVFTNISLELEQAAWIDGATKWQSIRKVLLPLAAPGIVTTMIYTFIQAWNEFPVALTIMTTTEKRPITVGIYSFFSFSGTEWQYLCAASLIATIPVVVLFFIVEKHLVSGLTAGGTKE